MSVSTLSAAARDIHKANLLAQRAFRSLVLSQSGAVREAMVVAHPHFYSAGRALAALVVYLEASADREARSSAAHVPPGGSPAPLRASTPVAPADPQLFLASPPWLQERPARGRDRAPKPGASAQGHTAAGKGRRSSHQPARPTADSQPSTLSS